MSTTDDVTEDAIRLARSWLSATAEGQTAKERRTTGRLAALVADPAGLELAVRFVDRVARPQDVRVAARELAGLTSGAAAGFLGPLDRAMLGVGALVAPVLPDVVVPAARQRLRSLVGHLVADDGPGLAAHLAATRAEGFRLNLNLLGEAVLGEREAAARLARVTALVERPDVDYVSVKVSAVASQLSTWDTDGSVDRVVDRLRPLYLTAARHGTFLNLDMEEYRDLALTVRVFERLVVRPGAPGRRGGHRAAGLPAGRRRRPRRADGHRDRAPRRRWRPPQGPPGQGRQPGDGAGGGRAARVVAGAVRLARRRSTRPTCGWWTGPWTRRGRPRCGSASPATTCSTSPRPTCSRSGGASARRSTSRCSRAWRPRRRARCATRSARCSSTPRSSPAHDFDVAISYLVRRLEENSASQNFLHALFAQGAAMDAQEEAFRVAFRDRDVPSTASPACARPPPTCGTRLRQHPGHRPGRRRRACLGRRSARPGRAGARRSGHGVHHGRGRRRRRAAAAAQPAWAATPPAERARALHAVAAALEEARGDLVATMVHETGKTVAEADPEVSEAVDFARYYADRAADLADGAVRGAVHRPPGSPWSRRRGTSRRDPGGLGPGVAGRGERGRRQAGAPGPRCGQVAMAAISAGWTRSAPLRTSSPWCSAPRATSAGGSSRTPMSRASSSPGPSRPPALRRVACRPRRPRRDLRQERARRHPVARTWTWRSPTWCVPRSGTRGRSARRRRCVILVGSVGDPRTATGERFRRQLVDAVASLARRTRHRPRRDRDGPAHRAGAGASSCAP